MVASSRSASCGSVAIAADAKLLVAVIGVGYIGTHLIEAFSCQYMAGLQISELHIPEPETLYKGVPHARFTMNPEDLSEATHILISLSALLPENTTINTSFLKCTSSK